MDQEAIFIGIVQSITQIVPAAESLLSKTFGSKWVQADGGTHYQTFIGIIAKEN